MLDTIIEKLLANIISGGQGAMISIFFGLCMVLAWWIMRLEKTIKKKDDRLDEIVEKYHEATLAVAESLNQLRMLFYEIKSKI